MRLLSFNYRCSQMHVSTLMRGSHLVSWTWGRFRIVSLSAVAFGEVAAELIARFSSSVGVRVQYQDDPQTDLPTLMAITCQQNAHLTQGIVLHA